MAFNIDFGDRRKAVEDTDDRQDEDQDRDQAQNDFDEESGDRSEVFTGRSGAVFNDSEVFRSGGVECQQQQQEKSDDTADNELNTFCFDSEVDTADKRADRSEKVEESEDAENIR